MSGLIMDDCGSTAKAARPTDGQRAWHLVEQPSLAGPAWGSGHVPDASPALLTGSAGGECLLSCGTALAIAGGRRES